MYECSTFKGLHTEKFIYVTPDADRRARKMRILHKSIRMILDEGKLSWRVGLSARTRTRVKLNYLFILTSHFCDIPKRKITMGTRRGL